MTETTTINALHQSVRGLDDWALLAWADAQEESGDQEGAAALRALPDVLERIQAQVHVYLDAGIRQRKIIVAFHSAGQWVCLAAGTNRNDFAKVREEGRPFPSLDGADGDSSAVRVLLVRWNEFHPAVEWFARHLGLMVVEMHYSGGPALEGLTDGGPWPSGLGPFSLARGNLHPVDARVSSCTLRTPRKRGSQPESDQEVLLAD